MKKKKKINTLTICVMLDALTALLVGIYAGLCFWAKGNEPTAMLEYFKWLCGGEFALTAYITVNKIKKGKVE